MDLSTVIGLVLALIGIVGGLYDEGGHIGQITSPTSVMIVVGGTVGAVMVQFPLGIFMEALKLGIQVILPKKIDPASYIEDIVKFSTKARKEGIVALEGDAKEIKDEFFRKALMMVIDGTDPKELKHVLENQIHYIDEHGTTVPKVFEAMGGYSPTIGIIGAVMGLIQVMGHLEDIEAVGHGIAVAFVATIYGVGLANVVCLPMGAKLTLAHKKEMAIKEMIIEGINLIIEGVNPMIIRDKLSGYFVEKLKLGGEEGEGK